MFRKTLITTIIVAALALAAVPFAYAQQGRFHHRGGLDGAGMFFMGRLEHLKTSLDLSDQQVDQIKAIAQDLHSQNAQYRQQQRGNMKSVMQALINNPNDLAGAQALLDQQAAAEKAVRSNMLVAASKALNVLTADQRTKLGQFINEHEGRFQR